MFLLVQPNGGKYWRFKYRFAGKEKLMAFGVYPDVSLAEARENRNQARKTLSGGVDPGEEKKIGKRQHLLNTANSFEVIVREWYENRKLSWTERHGHYVLRRLESDILGAIGHRSIQEFTAPELLAILREVEERGALDITRRLCQTCGQIFRYAIARDRVERDPTADLRGALKTPPKKHYSYLKASELPDFLSKLADYDSELQTRLAFQLLLLTFVRTGELRGAEWQSYCWKI